MSEYEAIGYEFEESVKGTDFENYTAKEVVEEAIDMNERIESIMRILALQKKIITQQIAVLNEFISTSHADFQIMLAEQRRDDWKAFHVVVEGLLNE